MCPCVDGAGQPRRGRLSAGFFVKPTKTREDMDSSNNAQVQPGNSNAKLERKVKILYVVILILVVAMAFMIFNTQKVANERNESFAQGVQLRGELDKVMEDYNDIRMENQDLVGQMSDKDSLIMANKKEIERLIARQADYNKIKKKLDLLRKITQEYVVRIDSLVTANKVLAEENTQLKEETTRARQENTQLKTELDEKISLASEFKAYDLTAVTVRVRADGKEVPTDRARRVTRINLDFTLSENKIVEPGQKTIYARISRPDGVVMSLSSDDQYSFVMNGDTLQYTIKQDIEYKNQAQEIKMHWDRLTTDNHAMAGQYAVILYMEGKEIGRTGFAIRD